MSTTVGVHDDVVGVGGGAVPMVANSWMGIAGRIAEIGNEEASGYRFWEFESGSLSVGSVLGSVARKDMCRSS